MEFIPIMCSNCFRDEGIKLTAEIHGTACNQICPCCKSHDGKKLDVNGLQSAAYQFFVWGSLHRTEYGAAPVIQFNNKHTGIDDFDFSEDLKSDALKIANVLGVGFFHYGPRLWMVGENEPLKSLLNESERGEIFKRIFSSYPSLTLSANDAFYRIRKSPKFPTTTTEYDSPPKDFCGLGRFDSPDFPILYGSQNIQICLHECRVSSEDELFVATLAPSRKLHFLDVSTILHEDLNEFESLDVAMNMLFLAGKHSYAVTKALSSAAKDRGLDGIIYPSYFSFLQTGHQPFETIFGLSTRRVAMWGKQEEAIDWERRKLIPNLAVFGRPIAEGKIMVKNINKIMLNRVEYSYHFGPAST